MYSFSSYLSTVNKVFGSINKPSTLLAGYSNKQVFISNGEITLTLPVNEFTLPHIIYLPQDRNLIKGFYYHIVEHRFMFTDDDDNELKGEPFSEGFSYISEALQATSYDMPTMLSRALLSARSFSLAMSETGTDTYMYLTESYKPKPYKLPELNQDYSKLNNPHEIIKPLKASLNSVHYSSSNMWIFGMDKGFQLYISMIDRSLLIEAKKLEPLKQGINMPATFGTETTQEDTTTVPTQEDTTTVPTQEDVIVTEDVTTAPIQENTTVTEDTTTVPITEEKIEELPRVTETITKNNSLHQMVVENYRLLRQLNDKLSISDDDLAELKKIKAMKQIIKKYS